MAERIGIAWYYACPPMIDSIGAISALYVIATWFGP